LINENPIVNYPFISSNMPASPAYEINISQFIRYSRACTVIFWIGLCGYGV